MAATNLIRPLTSTLAKFRGGRRIVVLTYHRVLDAPDPLRPDDVLADDFEQHVATIARYFQPMTFCDAVMALQSDELPSNCVALTFDDGYRDNHDLALKILRKHDVPATFFVATGFLHGEMMWNDVVIESVRSRIGASIELYEIDLGRVDIDSESAAFNLVRRIIGTVKRRPQQERSAFVDALARQVALDTRPRMMMTADEVRALYDSGMEIGAHTVSHPILANLSDEDSARELRESKTTLEAIVDAEIGSFAYPNGRVGSDFSVRDTALVREAGYRAAATTAWACATPDADPYLVPRLSIGASGRLEALYRLTRLFAGSGTTTDS